MVCLCPVDQSDCDLVAFCAVIGRLLLGGAIFHDDGAIECTFVVAMVSECLVFVEDDSIRAKLFRCMFFIGNSFA